jgi:hypothetical protein
MAKLWFCASLSGAVFSIFCRPGRYFSSEASSLNQVYVFGHLTWVLAS